MPKLDQGLSLLQEKVRNKAAADIFKIINSEEETEKALKKFKSSSDESIQLMANVLKIPTNQFNIYKSMVKGEPNEFSDELEKLGHDNIVKPGDIILMKGKSLPSKILVKLQKSCYLDARSSHVAIVQSEFVGVDAMPKIGVSMRLISEILDDVEDDWRIIRFSGLNESHEDEFLRGCAFYLTQPYIIKPQKGSGKNFSYCSELVRKIYKGLNLKNTGIPTNLVIKPCNFDKLADHNRKWIDITDNVTEFIVFTKKYEAIIRSICKLQIDGVKLNQARFKERKEMLQALPTLASKSIITAEKAQNIKNEIKEIEKNMNFKFWNYQ